MKVREAAAGDAAAWWQMRVALWPDADRAELGEEVDAHFETDRAPLHVFVCDDESGRPIGMLELQLRSVAEGCTSTPVPYIEAWYVVPAKRRAGAGRALIEAAEAWARSNGYSELASDTRITNALGERAHRSLGFEEVERAVHFRKPL